MNGIPSDMGIAVSIQAMVFGNMKEKSGTGVAFSRNPSTGENKLYGEFLENAQGDEITTGGRKPESMAGFAVKFPEIYKIFVQIAGVLEKHFKDMQEMEFTIEDGKLYMLQTRTARRTMASSVKIAVDMVEEGLISKAAAIERIDPFQIDQLLHPAFDEDAEANADLIAEGLRHHRELLRENLLYSGRC